MGVPKGAARLVEAINVLFDNTLKTMRLRLRRLVRVRRRHPMAGLCCHCGTCDKRFGLVVLTALLLPAAAASAEPAAPADSLTVGEVEVVIRDIFSPAEVQGARGPERLLKRIMNRVHTNTRERVIRRELLFAGGDGYDPALLEQTARNLRALGFLNDVSVAAGDTAADGRVDVVVSSRESWTLSTSVGFSLASGGNSRWNVSMAERNFLGTGVTVGGGVGADEDAAWWNLWYRKQRFLGKPLFFGIDWSEREDGHGRGMFLRRLFYAVDDPRGFEIRWSDKQAERRWYLSHAGPAGIDPQQEISLYARLPETTRLYQGQALWRVTRRGAPRVWRLGGGVEVEERRWRLAAAHELSDGRVEDLGWLDDPGRPMAAADGVRVFPYLAVQSVGRRWTESTFVLQYGPVEDLPTELVIDLRAGPAGGQVGSTTADGGMALRAEGSLIKWFAFGRHHVLAQVQGEGQAGDRTARTHQVQALLGWVSQAGPAATPWLVRAFAEGGHGSRLPGSDAFVLGLDRGLRTLEFDGMAGDRLARWNMELGKVTSWEPLGLARLGAAAFYNGGCAWWQDEDRSLADARHEAGVGLRIGPTRSANTQMTRIDVTWDLSGGTGPVFTAITRGLF